MLLKQINEQTIQQHGYQYKEFKEVEGNYVLSPSGARNFLANRRQWFRSTIKKENVFSGNLNTTIGSLIHRVAEDYYDGTLGKNGLLDKWKATAIAGQHTDAIPEYEGLAPVFIKQYLQRYPIPHDVEGYLQYEVKDNIWICGSYDALELNEDGTYTLIDFKTSSSSSKDMEAYILQLSIYTVLLGALKGFTVSKLRIVQIVKNVKPKINIIEDIPNVDYAKKVLNNMLWAIDLWGTNPELEELLFPENTFDFSSDVKVGFNPKVTVLSDEQQAVEKAKHNVFA